MTERESLKRLLWMTLLTVVLVTYWLCVGHGKVFAFTAGVLVGIQLVVWFVHFTVFRSK